MKFIVTRALSLLLWFTLVSTTARAGDPTKTDHMRNAIAFLESARDAKNPLVPLKAARKELVQGKHNKGGQRKDAIEFVDQALAYATTGDKKMMIEKINKAIGNAKAGITHTKK